MRISRIDLHYFGIVSFYQRRLPHWHPPGQPLFVTWRLEGSLPGHRYFPGGAQAGAVFVALDRLLDRRDVGPLYLARPEIASLVVRSLKDGQEVHDLYILHAFVVMPNHVHLLITPKVAVPKLIQRLKGSTARQANRIFHRTGKAFWQEESYDHWVRDQKEFERIRAYIEQNPVRAGQVTDSRCYRWSSAWTAGLKPGAA